MTIPTPDQTEGIWIGRTAGHGYHFVHDIFPGDTPRDVWHRANCRILITQGHLQAEHMHGSIPFSGKWVQTQRYMRVEM